MKVQHVYDPQTGRSSCPNCGTVVYDLGDKFCRECGVDFDQEYFQNSCLKCAINNEDVENNCLLPYSRSGMGWMFKKYITSIHPNCPKIKSK